MSSKGSKKQRQSLFGSPKERKEALRVVLEKAQKLEGHADVETLHRVEEVCEEADQIHKDTDMEERSTQQDQIVMDSEVMQVSARVIKTCTEKLSKDCNDFNGTEFAKKLLHWMKNLPNTTQEEINWTLVEQELPPFRNTGSYTCLSDWMKMPEPTPAVRPEASTSQAVAGPSQSSQATQSTSTQAAATQASTSTQAAATQASIKKEKVKKDPEVAIKKPENVVQVEQEESSVEQTVELIRKLIKRKYRHSGQPIDFFKLILNPHDFGKTIENMLHVSFLARDGKIKMIESDEGDLLVLPCSNEMITQAEAQGEVRNVQNVISLDFQQWKMLKDALRITTPMIDF